MKDKRGTVEHAQHDFGNGTGNHHENKAKQSKQNGAQLLHEKRSRKTSLLDHVPQRVAQSDELVHPLNAQTIGGTVVETT